MPCIQGKDYILKIKNDAFVKSRKTVTPAKAGVHNLSESLDSRFRGNDKKGAKQTFYEFIKNRTYGVDDEYGEKENKMELFHNQVTKEQGIFSYRFNHGSQAIKAFYCNRGKPLPRRKLLEIGWGYARDTTTRTVDNFIVRFRKYFERDPKKPVHFKSLRSIGYIFDHEPEKNG
jgi:hypothetical protein